MDITATSAIVLEVFALIAIGYAVARFGLLRADIGDALGDFVFYVAVPVLIFRIVASADFAGPSPWLLWLSYFGAAVPVWIAGDLIVRRIFGRDARAGVIGGVSSAFANSVLLGIPVVLTAYGEAGAVPLLLIISVHMPVLMTVSSILIDRAQVADGVAAGGMALPAMAGKIGRGLAVNPVVLAVLAALVFRQTGLDLQGVPAAVAARFADAAVPCALFSLGMSLNKYGIRGNLPPALALSVVKLLVFPALVWLIAGRLVGLPPLWTAVAVVTAACPTGVNAYLIANYFRTGHALAANTITITSAAAIVSMAFWLSLLPVLD